MVCNLVSTITARPLRKLVAYPPPRMGHRGATGSKYMYSYTDQYFAGARQITCMCIMCTTCLTENFELFILQIRANPKCHLSICIIVNKLPRSIEHVNRCRSYAELDY
jgi:hypothetical protein